MTLLTKLIRGAGIAVALGGLMAAAAQAQDVVLKLHQFLPEQAAVPAGVLIPWMEKIETESGGRIKFEHYPSMQLGGKPPELIDQVIDGVADVIWTLPGYTPGRFSRTEVAELPFMMTNAEATSRSLWQVAEKEMLETDFKDVKVIGLWVHGPGMIHANKLIKTVADLKGVKLRAPTRVTNMMLSTLGATAVGMPVPAVPESLSKGVIDGALLPWEVTRALKLSEMVSNHTEFPGAPIYAAVFVLAMNKGVYEGLPDDLKAIIDANSGEDFSAAAGAATEAADVPARQIAVDAGNTIVQLTPDEIAAWQAAATPTIDAWVADMTSNGIDGQALLDEMRAAIAANTK